MGFSFAGLGEAPLDDIIAAAQDDPGDDGPAMNEIVRRFRRRAMVLATSLTETSWLHEDLAQAALLGLVRAVRRHQAGRPGFGNYARLFMLGAAKRELKRWIGPPTDSLSDPAVCAAVGALAAPTPEPGIRCWGYGRAARAVLALPERQQDLLTSRYVDDAALATIATSSGTSIPAVSQRLATAHRAVVAQMVA